MEQQLRSDRRTARPRVPAQMMALRQQADNLSMSKSNDAALFILPLAAGTLGTIPTVRGLRVWYRALDKPPWTPPDRAFGPVWTTLYLLMGAALVLLRAPSRPDGDTPVQRRARATALGLFGTQLGLNVAWSFLFFGLRGIKAAGVEVVALWTAIAATIVTSWRVRPLAAMLLLPYLAWTTLATALNLEIWRRNRWGAGNDVRPTVHRASTGTGFRARYTVA